jgi:hypothetical protein
MKEISRLNITFYRTSKYWDFGNQILYKLCQENLQHKHDNIILTKVLFIGRIYSAAIERRRNKKNSNNDNFYISSVAPAFKNSKLDKQISELKTLQLKPDNIPKILEVHNDLIKMLSRITDLDKRSFASKYLHFHLPHLYFIYDSRALTALREFTSRVSKELRNIPRLSQVDKDYATFFCKCFDVKRRIEQEHKTKLTTRQFDNILIDIANHKNDNYRLKDK